MSIRQGNDIIASTPAVDTVPQQGSANLITSGGVYTAIENIDVLPSQTGNTGKFLTTDGTDASWADVGGLPD